MSCILEGSGDIATVAWRDQVIRLDQWAGDAFGDFTYPTQDGRFVIDVMIRPNGEYADVILCFINNSPPSPDLAGTITQMGDTRLAPANAVRPRDVREAIFTLIIWAEWTATQTPASI